MFSTKAFIEASRKFVCIRIETYENEQSEQLVKRMLNGRLSNTAFAILDPTGAKMLTRGGRSPSMAITENRGRTDTSGKENPEIIRKLLAIAARYKPSGASSTAVLQDFHSLRQALNCASADQRLLLLVKRDTQGRAVLERKLAAVLADPQVVGKFHLDFLSDTEDRGWAKLVRGAEDRPSLMVVRSGQFGLSGRALAQLSLGAKGSEIRAALLRSNQQFSGDEQRKHYEKHVQAGRRKGMVFKNEIPRLGSNGTQGKGRRPAPGDKSSSDDSKLRSALDDAMGTGAKGHKTVLQVSGMT